MTHKERVLQLLSDHQPHTHTEGYRLGVMLHSRVANLRKDGHHIVCWREGDTYLYQLVPSGTVRREENSNGRADGAPPCGPLAAAAPAPLEAGHLPEAGPVVEPPSTPGTDPQIPPAQLLIWEAA